jgi:hypothetical protein
MKHSIKLIYTNKNFKVQFYCTQRCRVLKREVNTDGRFSKIALGMSVPLDMAIKGPLDLRESSLSRVSGQRTDSG